MKQKTFEEIEFLLGKAEDAIWEKAEGTMLTLYWDVGFCLRDYTEKQVIVISKNLSKLFDVEEKFFLIAYHFYKDNPIKTKAVSCAV